MHLINILQLLQKVKKDLFFLLNLYPTYIAEGNSIAILDHVRVENRKFQSRIPIGALRISRSEIVIVTRRSIPTVKSRLYTDVSRSIPCILRLILSYEFRFQFAEKSGGARIAEL